MKKGTFCFSTIEEEPEGKPFGKAECPLFRIPFRRMPPRAILPGYGIDEGGSPDVLPGRGRRDRNLSKRLCFAARANRLSRKALLAGQAVIHRRDHGVFPVNLTASVHFGLPPRPLAAPSPPALLPNRIPR